MGFNNGVFSRIYNWVSDANNGIPITASRVDAETDGMATGLSTCVLKDGTQTITANIPMSGFKFTGVGVATAIDQYVTAGQVQSNGISYCGTSGGTANAQTLTPSPLISAYAAGQRFSFLPGLTNTSGTVAIANSGLATRNVKKGIGGAKVILAVGDLIVATPADVIDDGTDYILLNPQTYTHGADVASASTTVLDTVTGDYVNITGTTTITAITLAEGRQVTCRFTGLLSLTSGASLILPGSANYTTAVGDILTFRGEASGVVRCVSVLPASGISASALNGSYRNLVISQASNTTMTITWDELIAKTAMGGQAYLKASGSFTLNFGTTGANGIDTGALANNSFIYVYAIYNPTTNVWATLGSISVSSPTLPSGYTVFILIGASLTDGSAHLLVTRQIGNEVFYQTPQTIFTNQVGVSSLTSQSLSSCIAATIVKSVSGIFTANLISSVTNNLQVAADATGAGLQQGPMVDSSVVTNVTSQTLNFRNVPIVTNNTMFINMGNTSANTNSLKITSFTM